MQESFFDIEPLPAPPGRRKPRNPVVAAAVAPELAQLAQQLPEALRLGTSSWSFPGWKGLVWAGEHDETQLARQGLSAYAKHPLLRTVSLDRAFYRPMRAAEYAALAAQVPDSFRFLVKAPSLVCDAQLRGEDGRSQRPNPHFLDAERVRNECGEPLQEGLGARLGALVLQLSPLPGHWLARMPELLDRLEAALAALAPLRLVQPELAIAVEVRDGKFLAPAHAPRFIDCLRRQGATYALGLHPRLPAIEAQLPILRRLWPGPLVCRWNLNARHGAYGYGEAKAEYAPFDRLVDPDLATRAALARVIAGTLHGGQRALVTINNKAEGSAPLSVAALAAAVREEWLARAGRPTAPRG